MKMNSQIKGISTLIIMLLLACFNCKAQTDSTQNRSQVDTININTEEMPEFPGGETKLFKYISKSIKYPRYEAEKGISGTVYVYYEINEEGKVQNAKVSKGINGGAGLDQEALRVIQNMPIWKPGKINGRPTIVKFTMPVRFIL